MVMNKLFYFDLQSVGQYCREMPNGIEKPTLKTSLPCNRRFNDVCSIETIDTVDSQYAALSADDAVTIEPTVTRVTHGTLQSFQENGDVLEMHAPATKINI